MSKRQSLSYSQAYVYPDDHAPPTYEMTPEFKFFTVYTVFVSKQSSNMLLIFILWPTPQLFHRFTHRRTITGRELCLLLCYQWPSFTASTAKVQRANFLFFMIFQTPILNDALWKKGGGRAKWYPSPLYESKFSCLIRCPDYFSIFGLIIIALSFRLLLSGKSFES